MSVKDNLLDKELNSKCSYKRPVSYNDKSNYNDGRIITSSLYDLLCLVYLQMERSIDFKLLL